MQQQKLQNEKVGRIGLVIAITVLLSILAGFMVYASAYCHIKQVFNATEKIYFFGRGFPMYEKVGWYNKLICE